MQIYITNTDKDCDLLQDRPMTNKTATALTITTIWSWVPEGLNVKKDWLTDWLTDCLTDRQLQSNSDSDSQF
jgi:hypothetical protein